MNNFQHNLRELCEKTGISQGELAKRIEVTYSAVNQWANGKRTPKGRTIMKIARALGVPITALVDMPAEAEFLLGALKSTLDGLEGELDRLGFADAGNVELGLPGFSDEMDALEEWTSYLGDLYDDAVAFMIDHPYPLAAVEAEMEGDAIYGEEGGQDGAGGAESRRRNGGNAAGRDALDEMLRRMLSSLKESGIRHDQYELLESVCPHIIRAMFWLMKHAVRTGRTLSDGENDILRLYRRLNADGQETARKRLGELAQIRSYMASPPEEA